MSYDTTNSEIPSNSIPLLQVFENTVYFVCTDMPGGRDQLMKLENNEFQILAEATASHPKIVNMEFFEDGTFAYLLAGENEFKLTEQVPMYSDGTWLVPQLDPMEFFSEIYLSKDAFGNFYTVGSISTAIEPDVNDPYYPYLRISKSYICRNMEILFAEKDFEENIFYCKGIHVPPNNPEYMWIADAKTPGGLHKFHLCN
jgi:hypothetical protein